VKRKETVNAEYAENRAEDAKKRIERQGRARGLALTDLKIGHYTGRQDAGRYFLGRYFLSMEARTT
jgi:hypothetical protein